MALFREAYSCHEDPELLLSLESWAPLEYLLTNNNLQLLDEIVHLNLSQPKKHYIDFAFEYNSISLVTPFWTYGEKYRTFEAPDLMKNLTITKIKHSFILFEYFAL